MKASIPSLLDHNDFEFYSFPFAHTPLDLVWIVPGYRCLVDEYVSAGVVANDVTISDLHGESFNGSNHSFFVAVVKVVLPLLEFSGVPILIRGAIIRRVLVRNGVNEPALLLVVVCKPWFTMAFSKLVLPREQVHHFLSCHRSTFPSGSNEGGSALPGSEAERSSPELPPCPALLAAAEDKTRAWWVD